MLDKHPSLTQRYSEPLDSSGFQSHQNTQQTKRWKLKNEWYSEPPNYARQTAFL